MTQSATNSTGKALIIAYYSIYYFLQKKLNWKPFRIDFFSRLSLLFCHFTSYRSRIDSNMQVMSVARSCDAYSRLI